MTLVSRTTFIVPAPDSSNAPVNVLIGLKLKPVYKPQEPFPLYVNYQPL